MKTTYIYKVTSLSKSSLENAFHFIFQDCEVAFYKAMDQMELTVPGGVEESLEKAYRTANYLQHILTKKFGHFEFERIKYHEVAETEDEGNCAKQACVSFGTDIRFRSEITEKKLEELEWDQYWSIRDAVAWFIESKKVTMPMLRYICLYKVIEYFYDPGRQRGDRSNTVIRLKSSLLVNILSTLTAENPTKCFHLDTPHIIEELVSTRDLCSHLRQNNYGYSPVEVEEIKKVSKWIPLIEEIAEKTIESNS